MPKKELGFWAKSKRPIMALAPMANVTDFAFRELIAKYGKPDVFWTEFVSADGLCSAGRDNLLIDLKFSANQKPVVAQLFGSDPYKFNQAAKIIRKLKFNGIDINMGCPDRSVIKQGAGAALLKNLPLAKKIISAAKEGAGKIPVSVKIRIGDTKDTTEEIIPALMEEAPAAITIHGRTRKEMSLAPAHWDIIAKASRIAKKTDPDIIILGNGDVRSLAEAKKKALFYGLDGIMIGRGIFGNPWLFKANKTKPATEKERLKALLDHIILFEKHLSEKKPFALMKKHFKSYVSNFNGASELRKNLYEAKTPKQAKSLLSKTIK
jgi:nifR3 family TIM-barrel protein